MSKHLKRKERIPLETLLARNMLPVYGQRWTSYRRRFEATRVADADFQLPDFPLTLSLELVNRCNLSCAMCYTVNHASPKASLELDDIARLLAEAKRNSLPSLQIGLGSEALLYKPVREVLTMAKDADVMDIFLFTNGTLLNEDMSRFLVASGVTRVMVSLDAATRETFQAIRGKDELDRVESNIHRLLELRAEAGSDFPVVRVSFCVQDRNRHELKAFAEKWESVADFVDYQNLHDFSAIDRLSAFEQPTNDPNSYVAYHQNVHCHHPFGYLSVWANGDIAPCCSFYAKNLVIGNIREMSIQEAWLGERMANLRAQFKERRLNLACATCLASTSDEL